MTEYEIKGYKWIFYIIGFVVSILSGWLLVGVYINYLIKEGGIGGFRKQTKRIFFIIGIILSILWAFLLILGLFL